MQCIFAPDIYPDILHEAEVTEVDHATCEMIYGREMSPDIICVSGDYQRGACQVRNKLLLSVGYMLSHGIFHISPHRCQFRGDGGKYPPFFRLGGKINGVIPPLFRIEGSLSWQI